LLKQRLEVALERQHDLLGLGPGIQLGIGGHVAEEAERRLAELAHDALARHLAFEEATACPHHPRREEQLRLRRQRAQQLRLDRRVQLDQFLDQRLHGGHQVAPGVVQGFEQCRLGHGHIGRPFGQRGEELADARVVLDQPGDKHPNVVDRQFAHEGGQQNHQFGVRLLAVLDDGFQEPAQGFVFLFEGGALGF
jgi:hypothetical protein